MAEVALHQLLLKARETILTKLLGLDRRHRELRRVHTGPLLGFLARLRLPQRSVGSSMRDRLRAGAAGCERHRAGAVQPSQWALLHPTRRDVAAGLPKSWRIRGGCFGCLRNPQQLQRLGSEEYGT